jgi:hypothetical protein
MFLHSKMIFRLVCVVILASCVTTRKVAGQRLHNIVYIMAVNYFHGWC